MDQAFNSITDKTVLLAWNNDAHSSSCIQDTVTKLKEHIGEGPREGHLSLEHVERLPLGMKGYYMSTSVHCVLE